MRSNVFYTIIIIITILVTFITKPALRFLKDFLNVINFAFTMKYFIIDVEAIIIDRLCF